jgi:hypothetical protein
VIGRCRWQPGTAFIQCVLLHWWSGFVVQVHHQSWAIKPAMDLHASQHTHVPGHEPSENNVRFVTVPPQLSLDSS